MKYYIFLLTVYYKKNNNNIAVNHENVNINYFYGFTWYVFNLYTHSCACILTISNVNRLHF